MVVGSIFIQCCSPRWKSICSFHIIGERGSWELQALSKKLSQASLPPLEVTVTGARGWSSSGLGEPAWPYAQLVWSPCSTMMSPPVTQSPSFFILLHSRSPSDTGLLDPSVRVFCFMNELFSAPWTKNFWKARVTSYASFVYPYSMTDAVGLQGKGLIKCTSPLYSPQNGWIKSINTANYLIL